MAGGARKAILTGVKLASRPIPKRGQVKVAIVVGLAHSVASIFSAAARRSADH